MQSKANASNEPGAAGAARIGVGELRSTVRGLADRLDVKVAFVCETTGPRRDEARTLALFVDGGFLDNLAYPLAGTPCALVCEKGIGFTARGTADMYPADTVLADWRIDSYMGVACYAGDGSLMGHVGVMNDAPLDHPKRVEKELRSLAAELGPRLQATAAE